MRTTEDVFAGVWLADKERSRLDPDHRFQQATMQLSATTTGYDLRAEGVCPDGQPCVDQCSLLLDDQIHDQNGISVSTTQPHERAIHVEATQKGRKIAEATYEVSADGNWLTADTWGTDAQGRPFKTRVVFRRGS